MSTPVVRALIQTLMLLAGAIIALGVPFALVLYFKWWGVLTLVLLVAFAAIFATFLEMEEERDR